jgi:hypothetical protein
LLADSASDLAAPDHGEVNVSGAGVPVGAGVTVTPSLPAAPSVFVAVTVALPSTVPMKFHPVPELSTSIVPIEVGPGDFHVTWPGGTATPFCNTVTCTMTPIGTVIDVTGAAKTGEARTRHKKKRYLIAPIPYL